jgi:hypothetical protein
MVYIQHVIRPECAINGRNVSERVSYTVELQGAALFEFETLELH